MMSCRRVIAMQMSVVRSPLESTAAAASRPLEQPFFLLPLLLCSQLQPALINLAWVFRGPFTPSRAFEMSI